MYAFKEYQIFHRLVILIKFMKEPRTNSSKCTETWFYGEKLHFLVRFLSSNHPDDAYLASIYRFVIVIKFFDRANTLEVNNSAKNS